MVSRAELHALLDEIPDAGLDEARRYLAALKAADGDAFLAQVLLAPEDDEPLSPEEAEALHEAHEAVARGDVYTMEEIRREFGL